MQKQDRTIEGVVFQTAILIVEPKQANRVLAELTGVGAIIQSVCPIFMGEWSGGEDVMITYVVQQESEDAQFAFLSWVEDILGPFCKVF